VKKRKIRATSRPTCAVRLRLSCEKYLPSECCCLHGLASPYLTEYCTPTSLDAGRRHLRSAYTRQLIVPRMLRANIGSKSAISLQRGPVDPKFQVEGVASTNHSSQKTRLNGLSSGTKKSGQIFLPFCHNSRVWQTDRWTEFSSLDRVRIPCSAVK